MAPLYFYTGQQNGALPHFQNAVRVYLNTEMSDRWIGRAGVRDRCFMTWPPRREINKEEEREGRNGGDRSSGEGKEDGDQIDKTRKTIKLEMQERHKRLRWAGHVARIDESRNAYRVLVGRPEGKRPLGRPRRRWEDNIKMDLREVGYDDRKSGPMAGLCEGGNEPPGSLRASWQHCSGEMFLENAETLEQRSSAQCTLGLAPFTRG
ncbi:hypothetical protein ANN_15957 [Periplaneta americana]|uniref:Uncharacterized protein n=1 Tax=Periplaneta americana TaxID=6978 RepID=A0ABQ8SHT2_PERAM|nr:hypothetical protein ANN_15957 [Periplaneta americana]